jgi:hypothetical protein
MWGALLGGVAGAGAWLAVVRVAAVRRGGFEARVLHPLRDLPELSGPAAEAGAGPVRRIFGPTVQSAARRLERILGGAARSGAGSNGPGWRTPFTSSASARWCGAQRRSRPGRQ